MTLLFWKDNRMLIALLEYPKPLLSLKDSRAFSKKDIRVTQCDPIYKVL
jgi:hypothetical protein